jgi:hypothetical protein
MRTRLTRAALAGAILATSFGAFAGTSQATDACNNGEPGDSNYYVGNSTDPTLRVGIDDPTSGLTGTVVVCIGLLGDPEYTQVGGGVHYYQDSSGTHVTPVICLPDCRSIP